MKKPICAIAALALSALFIQERPGQTQKQVRPQVPPSYRSPSQNRIDQLKRRIVVLQAMRHLVLQQFTATSPEVRAIERQIVALRRELQRQTPRPNFWRPELQLVSSR